MQPRSKKSNALAKDDGSPEPRRRRAKRILRAADKIAHDILRESHVQSKPQKTETQAKIIRIYVALADNVGLKFLSHRNGVSDELQADVSAPWELRKVLIRSSKLKNLKWDLFRYTGEV
jgi:hypothetical protein